MTSGAMRRIQGRKSAVPPKSGDFCPRIGFMSVGVGIASRWRSRVLLGWGFCRIGRQIFRFLTLSNCGSNWKGELKFCDNSKGRESAIARSKCEC